MKATDIRTIEDAQRYIEGCINDLDAGISTKQQTIDYFAEYTLRIVKMARKALPDSKDKPLKRTKFK